MEWQRYQNPHEEPGEGRIMVPIQEVEIGDGERQEERIVQEYTMQITKFPREQDEFLRHCYERLLFTFFSQNLTPGVSMQR